MNNPFKKEKEPEDLKGAIKQIADLKKQCANLAKDLELIKQENKLSIKKVGMVRFNPFSNAGGDQSFSVALLDSSNNGVVITSLYAQDGNRVYGKPIENCISKYSLSEEEKQAIKMANN
jgi:hypothetical protein